MLRVLRPRTGLQIAQLLRRIAVPLPVVSKFNRGALPPTKFGGLFQVGVTIRHCRALATTAGVSPGVPRCFGCGGEIQGTDASRPGYIPPRILASAPLPGRAQPGPERLRGRAGATGLERQDDVGRDGDDGQGDGDGGGGQVDGADAGTGANRSRKLPHYATQRPSRSARATAAKREDAARIAAALELVDLHGAEMDPLALHDALEQAVVVVGAATMRSDNDDDDTADDAAAPRTRRLDPNGDGVDDESGLGPGLEPVPPQLPRNRGGDDQKTPGGLLCLRCHRLRHHSGARSPIAEGGDMDPLAADVVTATQVRDALRELVDDRAVVVEVLDAWDLNATALGARIHDVVPNLSSGDGAGDPDGSRRERRPRAKLDVILAVNKADVLPRGVSLARLETWVKALPQYRGQRSSIRAVHFVSARRGAGVRELAKSIDSWRRGSNVYLVGCTNTGKSTLVNALQGAFGGSRGRLITAGVVAVRGDQKTNSHDTHQHQQEQQEPQETDDGGPFENADSRNDDDSDFQSRRQAPQTLTTSHVPGTTAHVVAVPVLSVPVGSRAVLHDTPGVSTHGKRVTDHLSSRDVLTAMASGERTLTGRGGGRLSSLTKPSVYRAVPGNAIEIAGLARFEIVQGPAMLVTAFFGVGLPIKTRKRSGDGQTDAVDARWKWKGPPSDAESLARLPPMDDHILEFSGKETVSARGGAAFADIVVSGLGWISIATRPEMRKLGAPPPITIKVTAPLGVEVIARDPLLPYESVPGKGRTKLRIIKI